MHPSSYPLGHLKVQDDPAMWAKTITYAPTCTLSQVVSDQLLASSKDAYHVIRMIAEQFAKQFAKDIEQQLLAMLQPLGASTAKEYHEALYEKMAKEPLAFFDQSKTANEILEELKKPTAPSKFAPPATATENQVKNALLKAVPGLADAWASNCPACAAVNKQSKYQYVAAIIVHLNDDHRWSREDIADWLDTLDCDLSFQPPEEWDTYKPPSKFKKFLGGGDKEG